MTKSNNNIKGIDLQNANPQNGALKNTSLRDANLREIDLRNANPQNVAFKEKFYVTMTDTFLSGWGEAKGKIAKYVYECESYEEAERVANNARSRGDQKQVNICSNKPYYPTSTHYTQYKTYEENKTSMFYARGPLFKRPMMTKQGNTAKAQTYIEDPVTGEAWLKSYDTVVAYKDTYGRITLSKAHNCSQTTNYYVGQFTRLGVADRRKGIKLGKIAIVDAIVIRGGKI